MSQYTLVYICISGFVLMYLQNKICWKSIRLCNISQNISLYHLVQRHIVPTVRVTVAGQPEAIGSDSRLCLFLALTSSHCQPEAADSEPWPLSESERRVSHGHDHCDGHWQARAQGLGSMSRSRVTGIATPAEDSMPQVTLKIRF